MLSALRDLCPSLMFISSEVDTFTEEPLHKGRLITVDLLVISSPRQLLFILKKYFFKLPIHLSSFSSYTIIRQGACSIKLFTAVVCGFS
jgi:hypothetical protein